MTKGRTPVLDKNTFAAILTPEIEIVTPFLVALRNFSSIDSVAATHGLFVKDHFAFTNCDLVTRRSDIYAVVPLTSDEHRGSKTAESKRKTL
jgi:hypothetical protein